MSNKIIGNFNLGFALTLGLLTISNIAEVYSGSVLAGSIASGLAIFAGLTWRDMK